MATRHNKGKRKELWSHTLSDPGLLKKIADSFPVDTLALKLFINGTSFVFSDASVTLCYPAVNSSFIKKCNYLNPCTFWTCLMAAQYMVLQRCDSNVKTLYRRTFVLWMHFIQFIVGRGVLLGKKKNISL